MNEIELRFQIPAAQWAALHRWVQGEARQRARTERLQAAYFDTPARDLARAGFALRLRREGEVWVQTLKGAAPDGMTRLEHNVPLGAAEPTLLVARHADHPAGQALLRLLADLPAEALTCLFRTDITRVSRAMRTPHGEVELALDSGALLAGEGDDARSTPVAELEIELKQGEPRAVLEVARQWAVGRFGLTLELRTKALRGDLLARRETCAPVSESKAIRWTADQTGDQALKTLLRACLEPVIGNASQILAGVHRPEHLHQLRVGLRRLRVGTQLLAAADEVPLQALAAGAAALSRALTAARDADAQAMAPWRAEIAAAWLAERAAPSVEALPAARVDVAAALRGPEVQDWMLALIGWLALPASEASPPVASRVHPPLAAWAAAAARQIKRFERLDAAGRHQLRRRLRRLRLGLELALAVPGGGDGARLSKKEKEQRDQRLARVNAAQQALGALNDLEIGLATTRDDLAVALAHGDAAAAAQAGFALGFLRPRQDQALSVARKALRKIRRLD
ncbi:inorganic triphosphatase [Roseateles amylovorans]|uniref:CYTH domain-containing protein n=1 Tax=Roseateles amylovorans TaxID=2978473 RepID=A0ABY6B1R3_9BURK|nr:CYTH domain-containing protein [Roseateles amylovorans]UXH78857.1 CYTH domain-containing protein [Roseateles amylovorans]